MSASPAPKSPAESEVVMTQLILPSDANALQTAFGGRVMSWIDIAAAVAAERHCRQNVVTASMDDLHFVSGVKVGWIVTVRARVIATFRTSMEVGVTVTAENPLTGEQHLTTSALLTFVAIGPDGKKLPVPALELHSDEEQRAAAEAVQRREERISRKEVGRTWQSVVGLPRNLTP